MSGASQPDGGSGRSPRPGSVTLAGAADHGATVTQAGRDIYDIDVHASLSPAARKAARAKPLVVPHPRVPSGRLRGRDEILNRLMAAVDGIRAGHARSDLQVWVLHGMGGCGKTTIALEAAHRAQRAGMRAWWVSLSTPTELEAGLHAVAFAAGADEDELGRGHPADVLWRRLNSAGEPWLLVIDNADDPDLLAADTGRLADGRGWLRPPAEGSGLVVVTSREGGQAQWGTWTHLEPVPPLGEIDGGQVLRDLAPDAGDNYQAQTLCAWLGGLPLALDIAGSYLADADTSLWPQPGTPDTFGAYQAALEEHFETLGIDPAATAEERARRKLTTTWELSLDLLATQGHPLARPLLRLLACFGPAPIPYGALLDVAVLAVSPLFPGADRDGLVKAMEGIVRLGLVNVSSTRSANPSLRRVAVLPPLVRATNRANPDIVAQAVPYQELLLELLERAIAGSEPEDPKSWLLWSVLAAHCLSPLQVPYPALSPYPPERIARLTQPAHLAARYLQAAGFYDQAAAGQREVLRLRRQAVGSSHPDVMSAHQYLALALRDGGRWSEATAQYQEVLALRGKVLGDEHPDTLTSRHGLASMLRREGFLDRAESEYREVLRLRGRVLGNEHPDTLATRQNLALVLKARDQDLAAEAEYLSILAIQRRTLGEDHPQAMATRQSLAVVLQSQGRFDEADSEYKAVLELRRRVLGDQHPDTLTTRHSLAYMLRIWGRHTDAEAEYRAIIALHRATVGDDHPATLGTRHNLAVTFQDQGRLDEAGAEFAAVLECRRRVLGEANRDTLDTRHALAYVFRIRGQHATAEAEYRAIIALQRALVGDDHPVTLGTRHNLAVVLQDQGRLEDAEAEYADVLGIREYLLGADHHDTADTRRNLAQVRALPRP
jgi:tetratricopeptide (TPR) repeat protein